MENKLNRREVLKNLALGTGALSLGVAGSAFAKTQSDKEFKSLNRLKGNVNHSACRWCYNDIPLDEFARESAELGLKAIDLLKPSEWATVEKYGLTCSMATDNFASIEEGFNDPGNHGKLQSLYKPLIDKASDHGIKNVICFSGNRDGLDDKTGIENCAVGLTPLLKYAEEREVKLVMELLNSKVNHPDYQCDHTSWGAALCEKMGLSNFKLLYDIYHMQIMEGDVIRTIRKNHQYINHYHTAGNPGRHEIDDSQELFYPAIVRAILETGFDGYLAQEFVPTYDDKMKALKEAVLICDV
ncbi:hydroxypyruvate isomerase family protein [Autumnicola edwardsiae]|uniref:TIM barrel protein n=1 Tax=Autumnicola edwardsiae TaxID=3075594 RepID=A0ABU3CX60_9FLAO|nr:TIM barrel protein [Zunongwangia sp. F297]MDT0650947.1 TIM barrel protein [Zunongwangia sp. F297]